VPLYCQFFSLSLWKVICNLRKIFNQRLLSRHPAWKLAPRKRYCYIWFFFCLCLWDGSRSALSHEMLYPLSSKQLLVLANKTLI
jgi:hypothetical protein